MGLRFREGGKIFEFDAGDLPLKIGDCCIVKTRDGLRFGEVATNPTHLEDKVLKKNLPRVKRIADSQDREKMERNRELRRSAFSFCLKKIEELKLPMKLVEVEPYFDRSKAVFYFTAEGRVDFRKLVKELAQELKMRIEMRQIGVRDEAKLLGGYGICGRELCCVSFLHDFEPVSIRMAKEQDLPLSPGKISGVCGRLMCCLIYEADTYRELKSGLPRVGEKIKVENSQGRVIRNNIFEDHFTVDTEDGRMISVDKMEWRRKKSRR